MFPIPNAFIPKQNIPDTVLIVISLIFIWNGDVQLSLL